MPTSSCLRPLIKPIEFRMRCVGPIPHSTGSLSEIPNSRRRYGKSGKRLRGFRTSPYQWYSHEVEAEAMERVHTRLKSKSERLVPVSAAKNHRKALVRELLLKTESSEELEEEPRRLQNVVKNGRKLLGRPTSAKFFHSGVSTL